MAGRCICRWDKHDLTTVRLRYAVLGSVRRLRQRSLLRGSMRCTDCAAAAACSQSASRIVKAAVSSTGTPGQQAVDVASAPLNRATKHRRHSCTAHLSAAPAHWRPSQARINQPSCPCCIMSLLLHHCCTTARPTTLLCRPHPAVQQACIKTATHSRHARHSEEHGRRPRPQTQPAPRGPATCKDEQHLHQVRWLEERNRRRTAPMRLPTTWQHTACHTSAVKLQRRCAHAAQSGHSACC